MRWPRRVALGGAILIVMPFVAPVRAAAIPPSYTFHMDVAMAMRHFPWLHFHLQGVGEYEPGQSYIVHFTSVPWFFPKEQHDIDLSMLDPAMWSKHFVSRVVERQDNGDVLYELHAVGQSKLKSAVVTMGASGRTRKLDATYDDGTHIVMDVSCSNVDGFLVPATLTADIDEPHLALSANADFTDYDFDV